MKAPKEKKRKKKDETQIIANLSLTPYLIIAMYFSFAT